MDPGEIYAKTEEGLRELKERKRSLPITLRSLLIMVDGTRTVAEILQRARALRLADRSLSLTAIYSAADAISAWSSSAAKTISRKFS